MDPLDQRLQFLDLSEANEAEQRLLERVLYTNKSDIQLPWATEKQNHEELPIEQEWAPQSYDERELVQDEMCHDESEAVEETPQPPRNNVFVPPMWCIYPTATGVYIPQHIPAYSTPQPYPFAELEVGTRTQPPRSGKKIDKKQEPSYPPQYMMSYPPQIYQPAFVPMPMYTTDYHPAYIPAPEQQQQPAYSDEQNYAPQMPVESPSVEVSEEPELEPEYSPVEQFPAHEHICYRANVTLKPPKKKSPDEVPVEVGKEIPAPTAAPSVSDTSRLIDIDPPLIDIEEKQVVNEYPDLEAPAKGFPSLSPPSAAVQANNGMKSWVSLFHASAPVASSDSKPRPLARVSPFDKSEKTVVPSPTVAQKVVSMENTRVLSPKECTSSINPNLADDPYSQRLAEALRSYQLDHRAVNVQPCGLTNRSNWCYVNAILQALIACPSFYNLMRALPLPTEKRISSRTPITEALIEFVNAYTPLPANVRGKRGKDDASYLPVGSSFEPTGVYKVLDKIRGDNGFSVEGRQEDAEEFLSCLLNGLNDEMFEVLKLCDGEARLTNGDSGDPEAGEGWKEKLGRKNKGSVTRRTVCGKTPISDIFRGQLRNRVQRAGDEYTDNVQPFFTLQIDVEKANSVKDALELLVGKDTLEGMTCSKTNQEIEAWTQVSLEDLPLILILHLKCFDYKQDGCSKIMKSVDFTVDLKVDPKLMSVNKQKYVGKQRNYKLVAVVYHDGKEATKGHYVTDAYHVGLGRWIRYDDVNVRCVDGSLVLKPKTPRVPYLLYYRRADTLSVPVPPSVPAPARTSRP